MGSNCVRQVSIVDTIHRLREVEVLFKEKIVKCEKDIATINNSIRVCVERKSKMHAKILLRKRKIVEHDISNTCDQILALQKRISTLENLKLTKMQIDGVSLATRALSKFVSKNNIDRIEKLQDDMSDLADQLCDINQCFMVDDVDVDESELEEEYKLLETEVLNLPEAPTDIIIQVPEQVESEQMQAV